MDDDVIRAAYTVGYFFVSDIYAFYSNSYKGTLGKVQVSCLNYLYQKKEISAGEAASLLDVSKQHVSKILAKLESCGWVSKHSDPSDGRMYRYRLTDSGTAFVKEHIERSNHHLMDQIQRLSPEKQEAFRQAMVRAADIIGQNKL